MTFDPSATSATEPHPAVATAQPFTSVELLTNVFAALPGAYVLLTPELRIVAVSDAYLAATSTTRDYLVGNCLFEAFTGEPTTPEGETLANLRASLAQVLATGQPHHMARQRYQAPDPQQPG